jgi:hypothetical protein
VEQGRERHCARTPPARECGNDPVVHESIDERACVESEATPDHIVESPFASSGSDRSWAEAGQGHPDSKNEAAKQIACNVGRGNRHDRGEAEVLENANSDGGSDEGAQKKLEDREIAELSLDFAPGVTLGA